MGNSLHVVGLLERTSNRGLRTYVPPGEMPVGSRSIFHVSYSPEGWVAVENIIPERGEWFVCEKVPMTEEMK